MQGGKEKTQEAYTLQGKGSGKGRAVSRMMKPLRDFPMEGTPKEDWWAMSIVMLNHDAFAIDRNGMILLSGVYIHSLARELEHTICNGV